MNILLLLIPNLYDVFTLIMIGYAFMLHQKGELQIPFAVACGLIYIATRLGIFAGKLLHKILGQPQIAPAEGEAPDPRMLVWGFGPQVAFVVIFQLIMALCCLPHSSQAVAGVPKEQLQPQSQVQEQVQDVQKNPNEISSNAVSDEEVAKTDEKKSVEKTSEIDRLLSEGANEEEIVKPQPKKEVKKAVKSSYVRKVASKKSTNNKIVEQSQTTTATYDIPDRTLRVAGVSPAEQNINRANQIVSTNTTYSSKNVSGLTPKRYPGDDNPINTTWGYYKQTAQEQNQSVQKANNAQQKSSGANIPANTLRSIGY